MVTKTEEQTTPCKPTAAEIQEALGKVRAEGTGAPPGHLWIDQIECLLEMQQRVRINPVNVYSYQQMLEYSEAPPITVYRVEARLILVDGFHRIEAYKHEGREHIPSIIKDGTWEDALIEACTANAYNGQAMTSADKRRATETYLKALGQLPEEDPRKRQSLREIAKATGASHATVKNIREQLDLAVKILQFNSLDRVQVICPENWMALTLIETGTLGVVQRTDMKKGVLILTDEQQDCWVHPDRLTHSTAPVTVKILQSRDGDSDDSDSSSLSATERSCRNCQHRSRESVIDFHSFYCYQFGILSFLEKDDDTRGAECDLWSYRWAEADEAKNKPKPTPSNFTLPFPAHLRPIFEDAARAAGLTVVNWASQHLLQAAKSATATPIQQ